MTEEDTDKQKLKQEIIAEIKEEQLKESHKFKAKLFNSVGSVLLFGSIAWIFVGGGTFQMLSGVCFVVGAVFMTIGNQIY